MTKFTITIVILFLTITSAKASTGVPLPLFTPDFKVSDLMQGPTKDVALSPKEEEVAALIAQGLTFREVGKKIYITEGTVKTHIEHIQKKRGLRSKAQIVSFWWQKKIAELEELIENSEAGKPIENLEIEYTNVLFNDHLETTPTQKRAMFWIIKGLGDKEIAAKMKVTLGTTKTHLRMLLSKNMVRSREELLYLYFKEKYEALLEKAKGAKN